MTIDELLAIEEIKRLRIGYTVHCDAHDFDALAALFTEDAVCEFGEAFGGDWVGRSDIRANYEREMRKAGSPFDTLHVVTNPWIELTGEDSAKGRWYLIDLMVRQDGAIKTRGGSANPLLFLAIYEDRYRKVDGSWRISRTRLHFLWPEKMADDLLK